MKIGRYYCVLLIIFLCSFHVYAATLHITAEYNPAAYEAEGAQFINTTPCLQWPGAESNFWCKTTPTIDVPQAVYFNIAMSRTINSSRKESSLFYVKYPGPRDVFLTKQGGNKSFKMSFITTNVGTQMDVGNYYTQKPPIPEQGDCFGSKTLANYTSLFLFRRTTQDGVGGECYGNAINPSINSKYMTVSAIYLGYKLKAPNPYTLENGTYTGTLMLDIGSQEGFDFGSGTPKTQLIITFEIKVRHQLKVSFRAASGEHGVNLEPPGGWREWTNRVPPFMKASTPYQIWFSSRINVSKICEHGIGPLCYIRNIRDGHLVPIEVSVDNLAGNRLVLSGQPVGLYPSQIPSTVGELHTLNFSITRQEYLEQIMKRPGGFYMGYVTVIFDASI